jgi:hypothetical protein
MIGFTFGQALFYLSRTPKGNGKSRSATFPLRRSCPDFGQSNISFPPGLA